MRDHLSPGQSLFLPTINFPNPLAIASFKRRRRPSSRGSGNNSVLYPIARRSCERLTFRMMKPNQSDEMADALGSSGPQVDLAKGVLRQAKQDLRRFRAAQDRTGREMYGDAYSWVTSNDFSWPYSFLNVCEALGLSSEFLRAELLADTQPGWYSRSRRIAQGISNSVRGSLANVFGARGSVATARNSNRAVLAH